MRREAIAAMRRHVAADLEHELVAVAQDDRPRVTAQAHTVPEEGDAAVKAHQSRRAERLPPHEEELSESSRPHERDDTRRVRRPQARATARTHDAPEAKARTAEPDCGRDDHDALVREQLDVDARGVAQRAGDAGPVHGGRRVVARPHSDRRGNRRKHALYASALLGVVALLAGCGGGGSPPSITVPPARTYALSGFVPAHPVQAGKPTTLSFTVVQPDGAPLTQYRHGAGPHNGVHLIIVRRDLAVIIHHHPPVGASGLVTDTVTFPKPGPYRVVIDLYPKTSGLFSNYQLFTTITVAGRYSPQRLPPLRTVETVDGYRFTLHGIPHLKAIVPAPLDFTVTTPQGKPAVFTAWFGALAHAIFFRTGTLDYFHTHVCAPGASGCASVFGGATVSGTSATPGHLKVGVLVPVAGTWRLFLQCQVNGTIVTAPFTLHVS
jgi:hypothetical protein